MEDKYYIKSPEDIISILVIHWSPEMIFRANPWLLPVRVGISEVFRDPEMTTNISGADQSGDMNPPMMAFWQVSLSLWIRWYTGGK